LNWGEERWDTGVEKWLNMVLVLMAAMVHVESEK
jgi:hypothetical protein